MVEDREVVVAAQEAWARGVHPDLDRVLGRRLGELYYLKI